MLGFWFGLWLWLGLWLGSEYSVRVLIFPPEPSKECVKVSHVIFECRVINHNPYFIQQLPIFGQFLAQLYQITSIYSKPRLAAKFFGGLNQKFLLKEYGLFAL